MLLGVVDVKGSEAALLVATGELTSSGSAGGVGATKTVVSTVTVAVVDWVEVAVSIDSSKLEIGLAIVCTNMDVGERDEISAPEATISDVLGTAVLPVEAITWCKVDGNCVS
jgi:hypothetical protein